MPQRGFKEVLGAATWFLGGCGCRNVVLRTFLLPQRGFKDVSGVATWF